MNRRDVRIAAAGATLAAWWYVPDAPGRRPVVVMAHGFAAVKEMGLQDFAERFVAAGFAVVAFDHRCFGESTGEPRQEADPVLQSRDYRDVITWACSQAEVDPQRVGLWGTSYAGGHVLQVAWADRRVRCVVSQIPTISGFTQTQRRVAPQNQAAMHAMFAEERQRLAMGQEPRRRAVVPAGDGLPSVYDSPEASAFYRGRGDSIATWRNEVTISSLSMSAEYEPGAFIERISPTPLLMIVADQDTVTPTDLSLAAYNRALEPKRLLLVRGSHFAPYGEALGEASAAALEWFERHLG